MRLLGYVHLTSMPVISATISITESSKILEIKKGATNDLPYRAKQKVIIVETGSALNKYKESPDINTVFKIFDQYSFLRRIHSVSGNLITKTSRRKKISI